MDLRWLIPIKMMIAQQPPCGRPALKGTWSVEKLKPDPKKDDLGELLRAAGFYAQSQVIQFLLELGANPNDKPNGGSRAFDECVRHFRFENLSRIIWHPKTLIQIYDVTRTREAIIILSEHGAIWMPNDHDSMKDARWILRQLEPSALVEFIGVLIKYKACSRETLIDLLRTPAMKRHLATYWEKITRSIPEMQKSHSNKSATKAKKRRS